MCCDTMWRFVVLVGVVCDLAGIVMISFGVVCDMAWILQMLVRCVLIWCGCLCSFFFWFGMEVNDVGWDFNDAVWMCMIFVGCVMIWRGFK